MENSICREHSGCMARIEATERNISELWKERNEMDERINKIMSKINVVLGSIVVACIMLLLNIIFKSIG